MKTALLSLIFLSTLLSSCQAMIYGTAASMDRLKVGMTKTEVIETLGSPDAVHADGDKNEEYLIYKRMKNAISMWARTYKVTLRSGLVIKWDEQYNEQNVNQF